MNLLQFLKLIYLIKQHFENYNWSNSNMYHPRALLPMPSLLCLHNNICRLCLNKLQTKYSSRTKIKYFQCFLHASGANNWSICHIRIFLNNKSVLPSHDILVKSKIISTPCLWFSNFLFPYHPWPGTKSSVCNYKGMFSWGLKSLQINTILGGYYSSCRRSLFPALKLLHLLNWIFCQKIFLVSLWKVYGLFVGYLPVVIS